MTKYKLGETVQALAVSVDSVETHKGVEFFEESRELKGKILFLEENFMSVLLEEHKEAVTFERFTYQSYYSHGVKEEWRALDTEYDYLKLIDHEHIGKRS